MLKLNSFLCGVALVAVHSSDRIEWRVLGRTDSHSNSGRFLDFRARVTAFQMILLKHSHCQFPLRLYGIIRLIEMPWLWRKSQSSLLMKENPLSEWMYAAISDMANS